MRESSLSHSERCPGCRGTGRLIVRSGVMMTETCHICHGSGSVQSLSPSERAIPQPKTEPEPVVPRVLAFVVRLFPNDLFGRLAHDANIAALFELFDLPKLASGVRSSIVPAVVYVQSFGHDSRQVSIDRFDDVFVEDDHIFGVVNGKPGRWRLRSLGYKNAISINIQGAHIPPNSAVGISETKTRSRNSKVFSTKMEISTSES